MKARELRIGNLVNYQTAEGDILVARIDWQDLKWISKDEKGFNIAHSAIPLTEEWLLKFGFYNDGTEEDNELFHKNNLSVQAIKSGYDNAVLFYDEQILDKLGFVHQLQNLYFSLTGKELTIKTE